MRAIALLLAAGLSAASIVTGAAHDFEIGDLMVEHPWIRVAPASAPSLGGYMRIENNGDEADRLVGVSSPVAGTAEIHEMSVEDGVMRMRPVEGGVEIAPNMRVELRPGGYHVMFMDVDGTFEVGDHVPAILEFERAGEIEVEFVIEPMGTRGEEAREGAHEGHGGHEGGDAHGGDENGEDGSQ